MLTFQLAPPPPEYRPGERWALYRELLQSLAAIPGVRGAAMSSGIPMGQWGSYTRSPFSATGPSILPDGASIPIDWRIVSPGYFRRWGSRCWPGAISPNRTRPVSDRVVVSGGPRRVSGAVKPDRQDAASPADAHQLTVVGVVGDVRNNALNQEFPACIYSAPRGSGR